MFDNLYGTLEDQTTETPYMTFTQEDDHFIYIIEYYHNQEPISLTIFK